MASAAPTKKPYRKAPPQHRETRHEPQSSCEEGAEPQSQVKAPYVAPCQRTCFSNAQAVELRESDGCNLSCSSSWSLASSNDQNPGGPCARGRTSTLLRRVRSLRGTGKQSRAPRLRDLRRFLSRSEENIAVLAGEQREGKSRSLERSLVFKEPAEVLIPKKHRHSPCPQPLKSILKQTGTLNTDSRQCPGQKAARQPSPLALSPSPVDMGRAGSHSPDRKSQEEKAKFSQFLDEITSRVLSPCNVPAGRRRACAAGTDDELPVTSRIPADGVGVRNTGGPADMSERAGNVRGGSRGYSGDRSRPTEGKERVKGHMQSNVYTKGRSQTPSELCYPESLSSASQWSPEGRSPSPRTSPSLIGSHRKDSPTEGDRVQFLQQQNDELRRRLAYTTTKMEALEHEVEAGRHYLDMELGRNREELDKFKDKFRRLQNSYTASQRTNQDLEEKLHTLIKKAEMDRKTLDWEIVELTNKLLDAKATVNKLEELNERYRQDCNLAVQLLKCNKSHFRNHKFADLPYKLQDMVSKHLESSASSPGSGQDTPPPGLSHSDVVPTSVIARVLEKPESLILNSAMSSSGSGPTAEDVFVHVDMSGAGERAMEGRQQNGGLQQQSSVDSSCEEPPTFEKLSPYPTPSPPHPMYPGRKVIEFSDEKVRIPKNSPLPNCTYATRQAISLSLVQGEEGSPNRHRTVPSSPASAGSYPQRARSADNPARSPLSSAAASSASSEEDMLASWQKMFVEKSAPRTDGSLAHRTSFSRDSALELQQRFSRSMQELSRAAQAYTERESSVRGWSSNQDTDAVATQKGNLPNEYGKEFSREEAQDLLSGAVEEEEDPAEQHDLPEVTDQESITEDEVPESCTPQQDGLYVEKPPTGRPHRSPKRMGVHHLHRKDSLTRAQEQGNLLN